uniref:Uncharacterized protein n=1 Tax=Avena sativa TaxID=4498 RepID=A0ACD5VFK5_AVESA
MASLPLSPLPRDPFYRHPAPPLLSPAAISPPARLAAHSPHSNASARFRTNAQGDELRSHAAALQDCAVRRALRCGQELHARLLRSALQPDTFLLDSLLNMYCKCGRLLDARRVFDGMPHRDIVAWTAMVSAHTATGDSEEALNLFSQMNREGLAPNSFTLTSVLKACSVGSHSKFTHQVHGQAVKLQGFDDPYVGSSLVEAYTSCGEVDAAETVLLGLPERSDVSWNALLNEYARHGDYRRVMQVLDKLAESGDEISKYTLPTVLKCSEAESLINLMPLTPDSSIWRTILGACRIHGNIEIAERAAERLCELEPHDVSSSILLSNIYADLGRWNDVNRLRNMLLDCGIKKEPGCSWIEINGQIHVFLSQDGYPKY